MVTNGKMFQLLSKSIGMSKHARKLFVNLPGQMDDHTSEKPGKRMGKKWSKRQLGAFKD